MFILQAPYPAVQTTVVLPSAELGNHRKLAATVQTIRAMDGTLYTFIKSKRGRKSYQWDIICTKDKSLEVKEFVKAYAGSLVSVADHNGTKFVGHLTMNPIEFRGEGGAGGVTYSFSLQLEEKV